MRPDQASAYGSLPGWGRADGYLRRDRGSLCVGRFRMSSARQRIRVRTEGVRESARARPGQGMSRRHVAGHGLRGDDSRCLWLGLPPVSFDGRRQSLRSHGLRRIEPS